MYFNYVKKQQQLTDPNLLNASVE